MDFPLRTASQDHGSSQESQLQSQPLGWLPETPAPVDGEAGTSGRRKTEPPSSLLHQRVGPGSKKGALGGSLVLQSSWGCGATSSLLPVPTLSQLMCTLPSQATSAGAQILDSKHCFPLGIPLVLASLAPSHPAVSLPGSPNASVAA